MELIEKDEILAEMTYYFDNLSKAIKHIPAIRLSSNEKNHIWTCPDCGGNVFDPVRLGYEYCPFCGFQQDFAGQMNKILEEKQDNELHENCSM